jgi:hypothetical protein
MTSPQIDPAVSYLAFLATVSDERLARVAARRAFVEMKVSFMRAAALVRGSGAPLLQRKVRSAAEVAELWRLSDSLFDSLPTHDPMAAAHREEIQYHLDSAFPSTSASTPLPRETRRQDVRPR